MKIQRYVCFYLGILITLMSLYIQNVFCLEKKIDFIRNCTVM